MRYRSKVDTWLLIALVVPAIGCIGVVVMVGVKQSLLGALVLSPLLLLGAALPLWLLRSTHYTIDGHDLYVRSGPFRWTVPVHQIHQIAPTRDPLSSPALSLDRIRIDYAQDRSIMISPEDRQQFLAHLDEVRRAHGSGVR